MMFFEALAAAAFVCASPVAIDGDDVRCWGVGNVRLIGIDAPEMPGRCRAGRVCTPGDGVAARASLARIVRRGVLRCETRGRDGYGRVLANCRNAGGDIGCQQIAAGMAVHRYARLDCRAGGVL